MKLPKIPVSDLSEKDYPHIRAQVESKIKRYIASHPGCSVLDLYVKNRITTSRFVNDNVICTNFGHIEPKSTYAIAQKAMGHRMEFTCACGAKIGIWRKSLVKSIDVCTFVKTKTKTHCITAQQEQRDYLHCSKQSHYVEQKLQERYPICRLSKKQAVKPHQQSVNTI